MRRAFRARHLSLSVARLSLANRRPSGFFASFFRIQAEDTPEGAGDRHAPTLAETRCRRRRQLGRAHDGDTRARTPSQPRQVPHWQSRAHFTVASRRGPASAHSTRLTSSRARARGGPIRAAATGNRPAAPHARAARHGGDPPRNTNIPLGSAAGHRKCEGTVCLAVIRITPSRVRSRPTG